MIGDFENVMSDNQTLIFNVGTALSTKSIDLGAAGTVPGLGGNPLADFARGMAPKLNVQITTAFTASGGSGTLKVELVSAADAALTDTLTVLSTSAVVAEATLVAGYTFDDIAFPTGITQRYIGLRYTIAGNNGSAGAISAELLLDKSDAYPLG